MKIRCVWEHNGNDTMLYADNFIGAFTRGENREIALSKMKQEVKSYLKWKGEVLHDSMDTEVVQENVSELDVCDADTEVLFETEKEELTLAEYRMLKELVLKSARDFLALYESIPDKYLGDGIVRKTFCGIVPRSAYEMYEHTKCVNSYYFGEIGVKVDNAGTILESRERGFAILEEKTDFLKNTVYEGSFNEEWCLRKVMRRFIWHDRIHGKAMYRMAVKMFGKDVVPNIFKFIL